MWLQNKARVIIRAAMFKIQLNLISDVLFDKLAVQGMFIVGV